MNDMTQFLDLEKLQQPISAPRCQPPHTLLEGSRGYSIVMNLLGIDEKDIGIRVSEKKREVTVVARRETRNSKLGHFWVFGVPSEGVLSSLCTRYTGGALEIFIPKQNCPSAA